MPSGFDEVLRQAAKERQKKGATDPWADFIAARRQEIQEDLAETVAREQREEQRLKRSLRFNLN